MRQSVCDCIQSDNDVHKNTKDMINDNVMDRWGRLSEN